MKTIIFVALFALIALGECKKAYRESTVKEREQIHNKCVYDGRIDEELQDQYAKKNFPNDAKTRCYVKCYLEGLGMFKDGSFNVPAWKEYLGDWVRDTDVLNRGLAECTNPKSSNPCTTAYYGYKCLVGKGFTKHNPTFAYRK